jgi:DNA-binding XRE family transcriptional regulator
MEPEQYRQLRQNVGTQETVAVQLGINRVTLARRETGALPINHEAALALIHLQPFHARPLLHASENGQPFSGSYGIFISREDTSKKCAVIVATGLMLVASNAGRDDVLNRILESDLRGICINYIQFIVVPTPDEREPIGFEFEIIPDLKDFSKKGGKLHLYRPQKSILPRRAANSYDIRAGACRCGTNHSHDSMRRLPGDETIKVLQLAGIYPIT